MATIILDATVTANPGATFSANLDYMQPLANSNYAVWSQEQSNRGMSGGTILSNVVLAPDGTKTADKMVEAVDVNSVHRLTVPSSIKGFATISMYVKPAERSALQVYHEDFDVNRTWSSASTSWRFSGAPALIQNYTGVPNSVRFISSSCVDLNNNGWYRLTFTTYNSLTTPGTPTFYISLVNSGNVNYYNGDGSSGLFIWGIQVEPGKEAGKYVPTNATGRSGFKTNLDGNNANISDNRSAQVISTVVNNTPLEDLRPVYSTNLIGNSEGFTTGWYNNVNRFTITQATTIDGPQKLGVPTLLTRTSVDASYVSIGITNGRRTQFVFSVYAKKSVGDYCAIRIQGNYPGLANVVFNLATGVISSSPSTFGDTINLFSSLSANIVSVGDGWYRLSLSAISDKWGFSSLISFNSNNTFIDSTDSVANSAGYLFGAQLEYGSTPGPYLRTTSGSRAGFNSPAFVSANTTDLTTKASNIVRYSNMKTSNDSGWILAYAGYDLGVDYSVTDPDGGRGARHLALGNASAPFRINSGSYVNTPEGSGSNQNRYAGQLWIRVADGGSNITTGVIQINDIICVNFSTQAITQTWQKFTFNVTNSGSNPFQFIDLEFGAGDANRRIHIYGAQLELGSTNSAYVETGASKIMGLSSNARFL